MGDNLVGAFNDEKKDNEQIMIDKSIITKDIQKLVFAVTIYKAEEITKVKRKYIRLIFLQLMSMKEKNTK